MIAVYGNLLVMGVAVGLFIATINLRKGQSEPEKKLETQTLP